VNGISELHKLRVLDCSNNIKITSVNHIGEILEELKCSRESGIDQEGIMCLKKIKKIDCEFNQKIKNVNHLANILEVLD